jgi:hypothetical protein
MEDNLIKNGKFYNPDTSELIARSTWCVNYQVKRFSIYKSKKGTFFKVEEQADTFNDGCHGYARLTNGETCCTGDVLGMMGGSRRRSDIKIKAIFIETELTREKLMDMYEYTSQGKEYAVGNYAKIRYHFYKSYEELFGEIVEA